MRLRTYFSAALLAFGLASLKPINEAAAQSERGYPRLMQGPMVGVVTPTSVDVWMRASGAFPVQVEYGTGPALMDVRRTRPVLATKEEDYVVTARLDSLAPGTAYYYRVLVDGEEASYLEDLQPFRVQTAPDPDSASSFTVAFGSCARVLEDGEQAIWETVERLDPDLFFWTGDNVYGDALDPDILAEEYRRQRDVPALQALLRSTPHLATWDDHDYGLNNHDRTNPIKEEALATFERYWANPSHGTSEVPGVFFRYNYGGVDFFFVDVRYHRDPNALPDGPEKTMLGAGQLAWLKEGLRQSEAPFKVLVSGSGWTKAKGMGGDSWASFIHERDSLFAFIQREEITGVVLVSGDTHVGELNAVPWSARGGYDFYDLVSSPLAQRTTGSWLERRPEVRIRPVYFSGPNVGLLEFDLAGEPALRFTLVGLDGRPAWAPFELKASELRNGVASWTGKIDPLSHRRLERYRRGEGYYQVNRE